MFGLASLVGGIEVVFNNPQWTFALFALFIPLVWALLAGRAHDLGWPGWPFVALYMSPFPTLLIQMDERFGISGGRLRAFAELMLLDVQRAIYFWVALFTLAATPGQKETNRYGEQPSPGL
ncbi:DUF805 domain-containing protein [Vitreimonas flagellata]|uniref:DUF805 domain-containing protein n=1 Tax=Vitreimonas flagellata TaxID=2560861 RepID=UPI001EF80ADC|nr:DUF805 domain-containing protein [Vitreimonas flagellata]